MASAEVRRVENLVGETGAEDRTEVVYQLGAVIDGGWVPFLTKSEGYALHLSASNQEQGSSDQPSQPAQPATDQPAQPAQPATDQPSSDQPAQPSSDPNATATDTTNQ